MAAVLLAMLMCLTLLPVTAMAEIAEFPAKVLTALQSSEGLKTLFTPAETADKPTAQADNEAANEVDTSTAPFTVTDETGESYSLSPTTLSFGGGFGAYYKVVVPKGTETLNIHGETLVTAYCFHGDGNDLGYAASDGTCVVTCHACLNEDEQYYSKNAVISWHITLHTNQEAFVIHGIRKKCQPGIKKCKTCFRNSIKKLSCAVTLENVISLMLYLKKAPWLTLLSSSTALFQVRNSFLVQTFM